MASASTSKVAKDKKVILFAKTGDGKSIIANVLVAGGLQPVIFASSDAPRGCTSAIQKESGSGWIVTHTVGLGQADVVTTSNTEAKNVLVNFLKDVKDEYSHIIYVQKARRIAMEELIWNLLAKTFRGAESAFVILITAAETGWFEENRDKFPGNWKYHNVLITDIPPLHERPTIEKIPKDIRERSVAALEKELEKILEDRGSQYYTPARKNAEQLEQMSFVGLQRVPDQTWV